MLRFPRTTAAFAVLLTVAACNTSDKAATSATALPDVQVPELSLATLQEVTKELSSDAYEGRAPGTPGEEKTVAYIIKKYEEAGLKPGNKGKWTQDVPLVEITAKNATPLSFTGGKTPVTALYARTMSRSAIASSRRPRSRTATSSSSAMASTPPKRAGTTMPGSM
jgi:hypothetical protein